MEVNKIVLDLKVCVSILDSNSSFSLGMRDLFYYFEESAKLILLYFLFFWSNLNCETRKRLFFISPITDAFLIAVQKPSLAGIAMGIEGSTIYKIGLTINTYR
jgi:hypothetical protein